MHAFTIDENAKDREDGKYSIYKRRFLSDTPRVVLSCRLFGHKARRVDLKYSGFYYECKKCGARPENQNAPTPPWREPKGGAHLEYWVLPKKPRNVWSLEVKVGNSSSENNFAGNIITPLAAMYWGVEGYGERLKNALNGGDHYVSREIGIEWHNGTLWTHIWAPKGSWSSTDPKWQQMNWSPRDTFLGKAQNSHEVIETQKVIVPMPEGGYPATAKLERWERWRPRGRKTISYSYDIKIDKPARFIPVPGKGENSYDCGDDGNYGQSGPVPYRASWIEEAIAGMVKSALRDRRRYASSEWTPNAGWPDGLVKK